MNTQPLYNGKKVTFEEYQKLKDDGFQYEIIEGVMNLMTPAPFRKHQRIIGKIYYKIELFLELNPIGIVEIAPRDVKLDDHLIYQPDILFISNERIEIDKEQYVDGAPDFIIEVLSEGTFLKDIRKKYDDYEKYGVKEYWIINPDNVRASIFSYLENDKYEQFYPEEEIIKSKVIKGFELNLAQLVNI